MATTFKIGDKAIGAIIGDCEVWKISDYGIHVRRRSTEQEKQMYGGTGEYVFMVFHFNPTHHKQNSTLDLQLTPSNKQ